MSKPKVVLKWKMPVVREVNKNAQQGLVRMGYDILGWAKITAPIKTGALRNSIRITESGKTVIVSAGGAVGGKLINYAYKREQGPNRDPTSEHYMEKSFKRVTSGNWQQEYFGGITK